jgi:hypothetical protein
MGASDLTAGSVMDAAASLMNDTARTVYTYTAQIPYVKMALRELEEYFQLHNIPVTEEVSAVINIPAGQTAIVYNGLAPTPALPTDMVEPKQVWERTEGIDPYFPMTKRDFLPHSLEGVLTSRFIYYVWQRNEIRFLPTSQDNDIKIDYIRQLFTNIVNESSTINVINALSFLEYRTAGLLAEFIERNTTSANALNAYGVLAMERAAGISIKGTQNIMTRRRPFRSGYKRSGW